MRHSESQLMQAGDGTLTDNLTSGQIEEVLDRLINQTISPIIRCSEAFDLQVVHILSATTRNKKRKLSTLPREEAIDTMCQYLITEDRERKIHLAASMKLERHFVYTFAVKFLEELRDYQSLYTRWLRSKKASRRDGLNQQLAAIESHVGASRDTLWQAIGYAESYLQLTYTFRNNVVLHYVRHSYKEAKGFVKDKGRGFDFEDVYQNFLAAVTKAVDKFDSSKGALTSYINWWLLNTKTSNNSSHGHEYGLAYTIPQVAKKAHADKKSLKRQVNFSVSLEKLVGAEDQVELGDLLVGECSVEQRSLEDEAVRGLKVLAKSVDHHGLARLYLDIDEVFNNKERLQMRATMQKQLGVSPKTDGSGSIVFVKV